MGSICTETYLVIEVDLKLNEITARALCEFMRTKFVRFLHILAKCSHHGTRSTYHFVPVPDFSSASPTNWKLWVSELDLQLYRFYGLSEDEIGHVERKIRRMD